MSANRSWVGRGRVQDFDASRGGVLGSVCFPIVYASGRCSSTEKCLWAASGWLPAQRVIETPVRNEHEDMKSDSPRFNAFRCAAVVVAMVTAAAMAGTTAASASATAPGKLGQGGTSSGKPWLPPTPSQWPVVVDEQNSAPQTVTRGITHSVDSLQTVAGAQKAQVLNVDLTDPNVRLATVESHDHLTDPPNETVTSMARRTGAVAGINGDFFNIYGNGTPEGILIRDGRLLKSPSPSWPADLGVQADGSIVIGTQKYAGSPTGQPPTPWPRSTPPTPSPATESPG